MSVSQVGVATVEFSYPPRRTQVSGIGVPETPVPTVCLLADAPLHDAIELPGPLEGQLSLGKLWLVTASSVAIPNNYCDVNANAR